MSLMKIALYPIINHTDSPIVVIQPFPFLSLSLPFPDNALHPPSIASLSFSPGVMYRRWEVRCMYEAYEYTSDRTTLARTKHPIFQISSIQSRSLSRRIYSILLLDRESVSKSMGPDYCRVTVLPIIRNPSNPFILILCIDNFRIYISNIIYRK